MKFLLTKELGRLTKWLRILGFDAAYFQGREAGSLIIQALRDDRIVLTRNRRICARTGLRIILLRSEKLHEQFSELNKEIGCKIEPAAMFTRCIICNTELKHIEKEAIKDKVPEYVFKTQEDFFACPQCCRVYWQGTHWGNVHEIMKKMGIVRNSCEGA